MNALDTLITPYEVIKSFSIRESVDPKMLVDHIITAEETMFRNIFGWTFYETLIADLISYVNTSAWIAGVDHVVDDVVMFNNLNYTCIVNTTTAQAPTDSIYWVLSPKFTDTNHEFLWQRYLKRTIAVRVFVDALEFIHFQTGAIGIQKAHSNNTEPIDRRELADLKKNALADYDRNVKRLDEYVIAAKSDSLFSNYLGIAYHACQSPTRKRKRRKYYGFNVNPPT